MADDERHGPDERLGPRRGGPSVRTILGIPAAALLVAFAAANFRPVRVNFLLFETEARVVTVIVVAALLGFVIGWFVGRPTREERKRLRDRRASPRDGR